MKKKSLLLVALLISNIFSASASAEVLGNISGTYTNDMGAYSVFHKTEFTGGNAGKQTEYYIEYMPNTDAVPVIANDGSLWQQSNISVVAQAEKDMGYRTVAGINADYFSFKTGLPMGTSISGGEILSTDSASQPAIGFRANGTAFIDDLQIKTTAIKGDAYADIMCINKWYQSGFDPIYMLTDKFGSSSKTNGECIFVICSVKEGSLKVNSDIKLIVDENFVYDGDITIPEGKIVLVIDNLFGQEYLRDFMANLTPGEEFVIRNESVNSSKNLWEQAQEATSTVGGRLVKDGYICEGLDSSAEPRTAIGIKADGNIIMYTLDGRQSGYSYGAGLKTLAQRLIELGCVDAINLDGGGSTTIGAFLSGTDDFSVMNSPSDGSVRSVANYIFLRDYRQPTNEPWIVNIIDLNSTYYVGDTAKVEIESAYDTNNYKMSDLSSIQIEAENADVDENGIVIFNQTGDARVRIYGGIFEKTYNIKVHKIYYSDIDSHWAKDIINDISDKGLINGIEQDGLKVFNPDQRMTRSEFAMLICRFKELDFSEYQNVELPFYDVDDIPPWAYEAIQAVYGSGFMNGKSDDNGMTLRFEPNSDITRAEAMTLIARVLDTEEGDTQTVFADDADIPDWAREGITKLISAGIVKGYEDNTIRPLEYISRAEGAAMIYNCY